MPKPSSISLSPRQATPSVLGAEAKNINPIATAVIIATASAVIGYVVNFATERREVELTHINAQIEHLYGPLYSLSEANDRAWKAYSNEYWNERLQARRGYFNVNDSDPPYEGADFKLARVDDECLPAAKPANGKDNY